MASVPHLNRLSPEAEGIPSSAILDFIWVIEQYSHRLDVVQGFMLLRHGNVADEGRWMPYGAQSSHSLYSLSKNFTSTGIGLAVHEGPLTVDDLVLQFFPDDAPANPSENLKAMRMRYLLSMNPGNKEDTTEHVSPNSIKSAFFGPGEPRKENTTGYARRAEDDNWPRAFLSLPVEYQPGTFLRPPGRVPLSQRITQGKSSIWKSKEVVHKHPPKDRAIGLPARCASIRCSK